MGEPTIHPHYGDILDRISEAPVWFDENAVPRYCKFSTQETAYIYAREAALVLIECQACATQFRVAFTELNLREKLWDDSNNKVNNISDLIEDGSIHYGDPPNVRCCAAGASMNSIPIRVLEYWYQPVIRGEGLEGHVVKDPRSLDFRRGPEFEIDIPDRHGSNKT